MHEESEPMTFVLDEKKIAAAEIGSTVATLYLAIFGELREFTSESSHLIARDLVAITLGSPLITHIAPKETHHG